MPLVTYPDSDSDDQDNKDVSANPKAAPPVAPSSLNSNATENKKRKLQTDAPAVDLPPLPAVFHDLYATNVRTAASDDPSLHGGRKRQVGHVEGHWPTFVQLEWHPTVHEAQLLQAMIKRVTNATSNVHTLLLSDLGAPLPLHISLSRTLSLHTNERDDFLSRMRTQMKEAGVHYFGVCFNRLAWYPNFERNRWFLSLGAESPKSDELNRLLHASNQVCHAMKQPELYAPARNENEGAGKALDKGLTRENGAPGATDAGGWPDCSDLFHISLAWSLEVQDMARGGVEALPKELKSLSVSFDCVKVKIGNAVTSLDLGPTKARKRSFLD